MMRIFDDRTNGFLLTFSLTVSCPNGFPNGLRLRRVCCSVSAWPSILKLCIAGNPCRIEAGWIWVPHLFWSLFSSEILELKFAGFLGHLVITPWSRFPSEKKQMVKRVPLGDFWRAKFRPPDLPVCWRQASKRDGEEEELSALNLVEATVKIAKICYS